MLQRSKIIRSRDEWKLKAVQRADEIRENRKTQRRYQQVIAQLKAQFENTNDYKRFTTLAAKVAKSLRQTELAFLIPPKLRSKGRFQSIGKLARWGEKMLDVLAVKGRPKKSIGRHETNVPDPVSRSPARCLWAALIARLRSLWHADHSHGKTLRSRSVPTTICSVNQPRR